MSTRIWCCCLLIIALCFSSCHGSSKGACSEEKLKLADCARPFKNYVKSLTKATGKEIFTQSFMLKFLEFTGKTATCIGGVKCDEPRHYRFFLDSMTYFGTIIYQNAFHCLRNIVPLLKKCFQADPYQYASKREETRLSFLRCALGELLDPNRNPPCSRAVVSDIELATQAFEQFRNESWNWSKGVMKPTIFNANKLKRIS